VKPCICNLATYDRPGEKPRPACKEYRPDDPASPFCAWCEHAEECHKEEE